MTVSGYLIRLPFLIVTALTKRSQYRHSLSVTEKIRCTIGVDSIIFYKVEITGAGSDSVLQIQNQPPNDFSASFICYLFFRIDIIFLKIWKEVDLTHVSNS